MPDEVIKEEEVIEAKSKRKRNKSVREIVQEIHEQNNQARLAEETKEEKKDETPESTPNEVATPSLEESKEGEKPPVEEEEKPEPPKELPDIAKQEELAKKAEEAAKKEIAQIREEFQGKIDAILTKDKDIQEKQKEADELIAVWDKEGRLPKDYNELIAETMRINDAKLEQRMKQLEKERVTAETKRQEELTKAQKDQEVQEQQKREAFQVALAKDLEELYDAKFLTRPANLNEINNPNTTDTGAKQTQAVMQFGIELNTKRKEAGLEPVGSLSKIYFLHYKPYIDAKGDTKPTDDQPPGADAPISGVQNQSHTDTQTKSSLYIKTADGKYRAKTWAELKHEALQQAQEARRYKN